MRKEVSFKNRDRFIQLGIAISSLRKVRGMSQEKLAEKAGISRSLLSVIEAPNTANSFSLEVLYDIADALEVTPADLINASLFRIISSECFGTGKTFLSFGSERNIFARFYFVLFSLHKQKKLIPISRLDDTAVNILTKQRFPTLPLLVERMFIMGLSLILWLGNN